MVFAPPLSFCEDQLVLPGQPQAVGVAAMRDDDLTGVREQLEAVDFVGNNCNRPGWRGLARCFSVNVGRTPLGTDTHFQIIPMTVRQPPHRPHAPR
jgi:hypothetical protein